MGGDWLSHGTGYCAHCAQARVAFAHKADRHRYLRGWIEALDSYRRVVLPLRPGRKM